MIIRPAFGTADRIDIKHNIFQPGFVYNRLGKGYKLSVSRRISRAYKLAAELVKFS